MHDRLADQRRFAALAEMGDIAAAAERLGITQNALSKAIIRLEESCGVPLFERLPEGRVSLTPLGAEVLEDVKQILQRTGILQEKISAARSAATQDEAAGVKFSLRIPASDNDRLDTLLASLAKTQVDGFGLKVSKNGWFVRTMRGGTTAKAALDYAFREGEEHGPVPDEKVDELKEKAEEAWAGGGGEKEIAARGKAIAGAEERNAKATELECTAGDRKRVEDACERIEESAVVRQGRTAERFLIQQVIELPGDSTAAQRKACAEALVQHWEDRGHPATAAVHGNGKVQPHVHVQATARPVDADGNVDRSALLWTSKQAVRDERAALAEIVNEHCPSAVLFHGGRHEDVNIDREARKEAGLAQIRLPRRAQHRPAKYEFDDTLPARLAVIHEQGRERAEAEAQRKKAEAARKAVEREARHQARAAATEAERQAREDRKAARERRENRQAELRDLSAKQTAMLAELHKKAGRELPDLEDEAGRTAAWQFARGEAARQKRAADEAAARAEQARVAREEEAQREAERQRLAREAAEKAAVEQERPPGASPALHDEGPDGQVEAWQLTPSQFLARAHRAGNDGTDIHFSDVVPSVRVHYDPANTLRMTGGQHADWLYEHGGVVCGGYDRFPEEWKAVVLMAHQDEVHHAVRTGKPVPAPVLAAYPQRQADGGQGGRRQGGEDGGGFDFGGPSLIEIEQERQITR